MVLREECLRGIDTAASDSSNERAGQEPTSPPAAATSGNVTVIGAPLVISTAILLPVSLPAPPTRC